MRKTVATLLIFLSLGMYQIPAATEARIKDIAHVIGARSNQLAGFGLVVGLNGTGDSTQFILGPQALSNLLERYGITVPPKDMRRAKNMAAVIVNATLPPFSRQGSKIDITVSSLGDATSLQGGVLLQTPLKAADGRVYAVAQGPVSIGGFFVKGSAAGGTNVAQRNQPTAGRVPNGAIVEREVPFELNQRSSVTLALDQDDFTTAARAADAINKKLSSVEAVGGALAQALDSRTIEVKVPAAYTRKLVDFISMLESVSLTTDRAAKVIINEKTGTVILGGDIKISPVSIIHGNFNVTISTTFEVSQPQPLAKGQTVVTAEETVKAKEERARSLVLREGANVEDVVKGLNAIGTTPRDVIAIIQAIKAAGALNADLEVI